MPAAPRGTEAVRQARAWAVGVTAALALLLLLSLAFAPNAVLALDPSQYAALHLCMEVAAAVVSLLVFGVGWNAYAAGGQPTQLILGCGFLAVGLLDLLHGLSYEGMPRLVTPASTDKAIDFWLAARTLLAVTLLSASVPVARDLRRHAVLALALGLAGSSTWLVLYHPGWLPRTFEPGSGVTAFKFAAEVLLMILFSVAAVNFLRRAARGSDPDLWWFAAACFIAAMSETFFLRYQQVSDLYNVLGHLYKLAEFGIIYRTVLMIGIRRPYEQSRRYAHNFRATFDQAFQFMALLEPDGAILEVNQTAARAIGHTPAQLRHLPFWQAPWWSGGDGQRAALRQAVVGAAGGSVDVQEVTFTTVEGQVRHAELSIKPFRDEQGAVSMLIAEGRDVTGRKQNQEALRRSDERLRLAVLASGIGIVDHDHRDDTVYCSPEVRGICGVAADAAISIRSYGELVHPLDLDRFAAAVAKAHEPGGDGLFSIEHRIVRPDGRLRWVALRARTSFEDRDGVRRPLRTVGVIMDVTERRQREEALRQIDNRLLQAVRVGNVGIFDHDHVTDKVYRSAEQRSIYGWGPEEEPSVQKYVDQVHEADRVRVREAIRQAHDPAGNGVFDIEHRIVRRDGQVRWLTTRSQTYFEGEGAARHKVRTIGAVIDITERKRTEEELRVLATSLERRVSERTRELEAALQRLALAQEELVRSEKLAALGALVAGVAHELNTPLGNAVIVASTLQDRTSQFAGQAGAGTLSRAQLDDYLKMSAQAAGLLMRNLTQAADLVASFKQVAVDQTSAKRRQFDLKETIEEVLSTLQHRVKGSPIRVSAELGAGILMDSYPGPLGQVLNNLFSNALAHAFAGREQGVIAIRSRLEGEQVVLEFADDGAGIDPVNLPKIFDPFFTTRLGQGGSGLGLNIVYNIVTGVLEGRITVESQPGLGTRFVLRLPVVVAVRTEAAAV